MSGLGCRTRLAFGTRRRNFAKASLGSFKVNPRLRLGLTLNSTRLAFLVTFAPTASMTVARPAIAVGAV